MRYLSVCAVLDYTAHYGRAITQRIGRPLQDAQGNPRRRRGGGAVRSTTETVPNPAARFVGTLTDEDLRRLVGLRAVHHENRRRARAAIERLHADGVIDLETFPDGRVRIFGPGE